MPFSGYLDTVTPFLIHGWLNSEQFSAAPFVDVVINRRFLASVRAGHYRQDLLEAKIGDGYRAFWFNPFESLRPGVNRIEVFVAGSDQLIGEGSRDLNFDPAEFARSVAVTEQAAVPDVLPGNEFFAHVERYFQFQSQTRILALAPAAESILDTILARGYSFRQFEGFVANPPQAATPHAKRDDPQRQIRLVHQGPAGLNVPVSHFNLAVALNSAEHAFPSIAVTLEQLYAALQPGGMLFMDFPCADPSLEMSFAQSDEKTGSFTRIYSNAEIRSFFLTAGFEVMELVHPLGVPEHSRVLAIAAKPESNV